MTDPNNNLVDAARKIAETAHAQQLDKAGAPYMEHVNSVVASVNTDKEKAVAFLHDVFEDSDKYTFDDLRERGFDEEIINALDAITRRDNEKYFEYIERVAANDLARTVKIADLTHNSDMTRMPEEAVDKFKSLLGRYQKALKILTSH